MKTWRPHRFPPLAQRDIVARPGEATQLQSSLAQGYQQGMDDGYRDGYDAGLDEGRRDGQAQGHAEGLTKGTAEARRAAQVRVEQLAAPFEAMLSALKTLQADYQDALREEVVELVAKVARQVIRCELALQPVQLLSLVDETLAALPPTDDSEVTVYLNPEECQRIRELAPERAARWTLLADSRLEPGECRVKSGNHEADAGCRHRLEAVMEQVASQLAEPGTEVRP